MKSSLYAVVDVGSNSALLTISDLTDGKLVNRIQKTASVRLGEDLRDGSNRIGAAAIKRLSQTLRRFVQTVHNVDAEFKTVILTEAIRRAENQEEVLEVVQKHLEIEPTILSGEDEAYLAWLAIATRYEQTDFCALDIGAGSSELASIDNKISLPLGALRCQQEFGSFPSDSVVDGLEIILKQELLEDFKGRELFVSGGTASALVMILKKMETFDEGSIEGYLLTLDEVEKVLTQFMSLSAEVIEQFPGLDARRGEIFLPGLRILQSFLNHLKPTQIRVSTLGVRYGALIQSLNVGSACD